MTIKFKWFSSKQQWAKRTVTGEKPTDISLDELNNRLMSRLMDTTKQIKILDVYSNAIKNKEKANQDPNNKE